MSTENNKTRDMLLDELDTVDERHQAALFTEWGQLIADDMAQVTFYSVSVRA